MIDKIKKRNGSIVDFDAHKLLKWAEWAAVVGADWFSVASEAYKKLPENPTTVDLQNAMIMACLDVENTPHLMMAGRLLIGNTYKELFGGHKNIPSLKVMYENMVAKGLWEDMGYTSEELDLLDKVISHKKDLKSPHSVINQIVTKYAISDVETGKPLETPQFVWMRMALGLCKEEKEDRVKKVTEYYKDFSNGKINAPTPNIKNLGTLGRGYASCCIFKSNDSAKSLAAGDHIAYTMTCASAGIGGYLETRSKGEGVRNNTIKHSGKLPYYRTLEAAVHANLQAGRGGACTVYYNCLDPEIETLLRLRHPTTVAKNRIGGIDYSFSFHPYLAEKAAKGEKWMLVSYKSCPELHEAMYKNDDSFYEVYDNYEKSKGKKKFVDARQLVIEFLRMQEETGRKYEMNIREMNRHTPFKDPVYSSNLCLETGLPTKGYDSIEDLYKYEETSGEIALCNLGAIVAGRVSFKEYEEVAYRALKMVDNVIEIMDYPFENLRYTAQARRSAGIGITNLAHDMAEKGLKYDTIEGKQYMHRLAEIHSYSLHKASVRLAKERGKCAWFDRTKYADGWLPIDTANKFIDTVVNQPLLCDWEGLREEIKQYGMRNSVLEAYMPVESSSIAGNTTNSIYPIRRPVVSKSSGTNKNVFIAPDWEMLKNNYQFAWDVPQKDIIEMYAIFQKFCGQSISADSYRSFTEGETPRISAKELIDLWLYRIKCGMKTKYYTNTEAGVKPVVIDEADCVGCKL